MKSGNMFIFAVGLLVGGYIGMKLALVLPAAKGEDEDGRKLQHIPIRKYGSNPSPSGKRPLYIPPPQGPRR